MKSLLKYSFAFFLFLSSACFAQTISVTSTSITCATPGSATVSVFGGTGPFSFTWMPGGQTGSVATGISPGSYTITTFDAGNNSTFTSSTVFVSLIPFTGNLNNTASITCNAAATGTANYTNLSGGSGSQTYLWTNGSQSYTNAIVNGLSAGTWSAAVTDALTGCVINNVFTISQPPALTVNIAANTPTACATTSIILTGTATGGAPGYNYNWTFGPTSPTNAVTQYIGGSFVYTLNTTDAYSCTATKTIAVTFIPFPFLSVNNASICPLQTATLTVSGATSYTWSNNTTGNTFTANPLNTTQYTVMGSALGCTAATSPNIVVKLVPVAGLVINGPVCSGSALSLSGTGGISYSWTGPTGFNSALQNPTISSVSPGNAGVYVVTVTAANSCTASASTNVSVTPTPTPVPALSSNSICLQALGGSPNSLTLNASGATLYMLNIPYYVITYSYTGTTWVLNPAQPYVSAGPATFTLTGLNNLCQASVTGSFAVIANPTVSISSASAVICAGQNFTYIVSGAGSYTWSSATPGNTFYTSGIAAVVSPSTTSVYTVTGSSQGCNSDPQTSTLTVKPAPLLTASGSTVCFGHAAGLSVSGAQTYSWSGPGGFNSSLSILSIPSATNAQPATYTVIGTGSNLCTSAAIVTISALSLPQVSVSATSSQICAGESVTLSASGATYYSWLSPISLANISVVLMPSATASYTVSGTDVNGCANTAVIFVTVNICTGIKEIQNAENNVLIYPNPSNGNFIIEGKTQLQLTLVNSLGQPLRAIELNEENEYRAIVPGTGAGIYYLVSPGKSLNKKIIIVK